MKKPIHKATEYDSEAKGLRYVEEAFSLQR